MKTFAVRLEWTLVSLLVICLISLIVVLNTPLLTPVAQWLVRTTYLPDFYVEEVTYAYPLHFQFKQVQINRHTPYIASADVWVNPSRSSWNHLYVDSVLLNHLSLSTANRIELPPLSNITVAQLAMKDVDIIGPNWMAEDANIQIKDPQWRNDTPLLPYGNIQTYIPTFTWHDETFTDLLINGELAHANSVIYGLSAQWLNGDISLQAKQNHNRWTILSLNVSNVHLTDTNYHHIQTALASPSNRGMTTIQRLDVLNGQYQGPLMQISDFNLSLDNLNLNADTLWQQSDAVLSASADGLSFNHTQWIDINLQLELLPQQIKIADLNGKVLDGSASLAATITPEHTNIEWLKLQNIKYYIESAADTIQWQKWQSYCHHLTIKHGTILGSQIIQLKDKPFWQVSGFNADITNVVMMNQAHPDTWSGSLELSANNLSYAGQLGYQANMQLHSDGQTLSLDNLSIPFKHGGIQAQGAWHFAQPNSDWSLSAQIQSLPTTILKPWLSPAVIDGLANLNLSVSGNMMDHRLIESSLAGKMDLQINQGTLLIPSPHFTLVTPFVLPHVTITGVQGKFTMPSTPLQGPDLKAKIQGNLDFTASENNHIQLSFNEQCQTMTYDLFTQQHHIIDQCPPPSTTNPTTAYSRE